MTSGGASNSAIIYLKGQWSALYNVPSSVATNFVGINNIGQIVGNYSIVAGITHGMILSGVQGLNLSNATLTYFDPPGATNATIVGINDQGLAVGTFVDVNGTHHGFEYNSTSGSYTQLDCSGANVIGTDVWGVNNKGQIAGAITNASGVHAFRSQL